MKKRIILNLLLIVALFAVTGCSGAKTKLSCYKDFTLFHSKQHIENKIYLDKNNRLIGYEYIESYYEFDSDNEYDSACTTAKDEALNNTKIYDYLTQTYNCSNNPRMVSMIYKYDLSKVTSKNNLEGKNMRGYLDDKYVLDVDNYKNSVTGKGYTCE